MLKIRQHERGVSMGVDKTTCDWHFGREMYVNLRNVRNWIFLDNASLQAKDGAASARATNNEQLEK